MFKGEKFLLFANSLFNFVGALMHAMCHLLLAVWILHVYALHSLGSMCMLHGIFFGLFSDSRMQWLYDWICGSFVLGEKGYIN